MSFQQVDQRRVTPFTSQSYISNADSLLLLQDCYTVEPVHGSGRRIAIIPRAEFAFDEFCSRTPHRSIALDGFVKGGATQDLRTLHFNFDHHGGCVRDFTLCTAQQVALMLSQGLMNMLHENDVANFWVFMNDPDPDSTLASYQFIHPHLRDSVVFRRLLHGFVAPLDVSAGTAGPDIHSDLMRQGAWIFEPYFRELSRVYSMNGKQIADLTLEIYDRIGKHLMGNGHMGDIDGRISELARGDGWMMIQEHGAHSRLKTFQSNPSLQGIVVFKGETAGEYRYSAVRHNRLSYFPVELLSDSLNRVEFFVERANLEALGELVRENATHPGSLWTILAAQSPPAGWTKPWGGGDAVIGCLRTKGSALPAAMMKAFVDAFMRDLAHKAYNLGCFTLTSPLVGDLIHESGGAYSPV